MFLTCTLIDTVPVAAGNLAKPTAKAVLETLEELYLDKVIPDLGLAVSVYNVLEIKGGFVYPSDSSAYFDVSFELVVFRPVKGEVFVGRSHSAERAGVHVSLGFFSDIFVPEFNMQQPSQYNDETNEWAWKPEGLELFLDLDEPIRLRVSEVRFRTPPTPGEMKQALATQKPETVEGTAARPFAVMQIIATINGEGLGPLAWWDEPAENQQEGDEAEGEEEAADMDQDR